MMLYLYVQLLNDQRVISTVLEPFLVAVQSIRFDQPFLAGYVSWNLKKKTLKFHFVGFSEVSQSHLTQTE